MIKTIIFDNGGVLVTDYWLEFMNRLVHKYGQEPGSITDQINKMDQLASEGKITQEEIHGFIRERVDVPVLEELFIQQNPLRPEVVEYIQELKRSYEVALLSNDFTGFDEENKVWHMENIFGDNVFISAKIGLRKPKPEIYNYVLAQLNRKPQETVFIDDRERNLIGARSVGMNVIQFISLEQLKRDLETLLKENNA